MNVRPFLQEVSLERKRIPDPNSYPFNLPAVRELRRLKLHRDVTFIVGENGCGKSTILEGIAAGWGFNPEGGTINFRFSTYPSHSELYKHLRLVKSFKRPKDGFFLRAESFFNVATNIDQISATDFYGGKSLHEQSHGESFLALLLNRFGGNGLYILDEPEAALSPLRQLSVLRRIHDLVGQHSQFIIATHSPILMAYPNAKILQLDKDGFTEISYQETEHYLITKEFMNDPEGMIHRLMSERNGEDS